MSVEFQEVLGPYSILRPANCGWCGGEIGEESHGIQHLATTVIGGDNGATYIHSSECIGSTSPPDFGELSWWERQMRSQANSTGWRHDMQQPRGLAHIKWVNDWKHVLGVTCTFAVENDCRKNFEHIFSYWAANQGHYHFLKERQMHDFDQRFDRNIATPN